MKHLLAIGQLSKKEILQLIQEAQIIKEKGFKKTQEGKILANCFFEPSTRTRLCFETAFLRLGGKVIGFSDDTSLSTKKGETLFDSIKVIGSYCDLIVIRHPQEKSAEHAASATTKPVINAGDGANEHPTQTLLDLFTLQECQGKLDKLNIILAGDLLHARTAHSLALGLKHFSPRLFFVSPESLQMPKKICDALHSAKITFTCHSSFEEVIDKGDILYMTRLQKERFVQEHASSLQITADLLKRAPKHLKILHPLPRVDEIHPDVDATEHAYYFQQAENGVYMRAALINAILQGES